MIVVIDGYNVIIDDEDYPISIKYKYRARKRGDIVYFCYSYMKNYKRLHFYLHREIMGCLPGDGKTVDHRDCNTLDNRKSNLRICTVAENTHNQRMRTNNTTGYKGVCYFNGTWRAHIRINYKKIHLGCFDNPVSAYNAYCEASKKYHGEYGRVK